MNLDVAFSDFICVRLEQEDIESNPNLELLHAFDKTLSPEQTKLFHTLLEDRNHIDANNSERAYRLGFSDALKLLS